MTETVIRVENLGKRYMLGQSRQPSRHDTFRETITDALHRSFRRSAPAPTSEDFWALKDVSFDIRRGEVLGIIGRNGAGKSTLLKILSRITEPTTGRITVKGRVASLLEVGTGFHPELTGRENIFLNGAILGMHRQEIKAKFDEIVAFAEVEKFLDTPVKRYSSGMYVRLAFAVAAHLEPEILIVDEVLAVGDAEFQKKCLGKMEDVSQRQGRTVIFVSHQMNAVEQLCTRTLLLETGQVRLNTDDVRTVIREYLFGRETEEETRYARWQSQTAQYDNPWFAPRSMYVAGETGEMLSLPVSNDTTMWLQIDAEVSQLDPALTIGYAIYAETNELLYWSYQTDMAEERWPQLSVGKVSVRGQIPSRFLNEGVYRIELIGGLHHRQWLFEPSVSAPSLTLRLRGKLSDSPLWLEKRPGLLAPTLPWALFS